MVCINVLRQLELMVFIMTTVTKQQKVYHYEVELKRLYNLLVC